MNVSSDDVAELFDEAAGYGRRSRLLSHRFGTEMTAALGVVGAMRMPWERQGIGLERWIQQESERLRRHLPEAPSVKAPPRVKVPLCKACGFSARRHQLFGCRPAVALPPSTPSTGLARWLAAKARRRAT